MVAGCALAVAALPAQATDELPAMIAGLMLVTAMGVQNGLHRTHLSVFPPSTLMTGTTPQIVIDLADALSGKATAVTPARTASMTRRVAVFAARRASLAVLVLLIACVSYPFYTLGLRNSTIGLFGNLATICLSIWVAIRVGAISRLSLVAPLAVAGWLLFASAALVDEWHFFG